MPKPERYDLKANVPIELRLGKIYQNDGDHGPYIRILAHMREPSEPDYTYRSILGDYDLLAQFYQLGYAEEETKLNEDGLPYVNTIKEGETDVLRILLEEKKNKQGKRFTKARITHVWDGEIWQEAPELVEVAADPAPAATPPPPAGPRPTGISPPPAASPPPAPQAATTTAPVPVVQPIEGMDDPMPAPVPAPTTGKTKHEPVTVGYAYHQARCLAMAAGVTKADLVQATATIFISVMQNQVPDPSKWYRTLFEEAKEGVGDDSLPF